MIRRVVAALQKKNSHSKTENQQRGRASHCEETCEMEPLPTAGSKIHVIILLINPYNTPLWSLNVLDEKPFWSVQQGAQPWLSLSGKTGKVLESLQVGNPASRSVARILWA